MTADNFKFNESVMLMCQCGKVYVSSRPQEMFFEKKMISCVSCKSCSAIFRCCCNSTAAIDYIQQDNTSQQVLYFTVVVAFKCLLNE